MPEALKQILRAALLLTVAILSSAAQAQPGDRVASSLLLLIDASGSMGDPVGGGHPQAKIDAAKQAATAALGRAARGGAVEVAVLAFSGDCANPVPNSQAATERVIVRLTSDGKRLLDELRLNRFKGRTYPPDERLTSQVADELQLSLFPDEA